MRKMLWLTLGFAAACGACANVFWNYDLMPWILGTALLGILLLCFPRTPVSCKRIGAVFLGISLGFSWFWAFQNRYLHPVESMDRTTVPLTITASDYSQKSRYSYSVEGTAEIQGKRYRMIVYLKDNPDIRPGDILTSEFRLRLTAPAGENDSDYYQGLGVFLTASQKGELEITRPEKMPLVHIPAVLSKQVRTALGKCFPEDTQAFVKALLLGDTRSLSYEEDTALKVSGIRHIAAVSGLHVSLIFGLVLLLCRFHIRLTVLVAAPVLAVFAAMTGFTPSVTRACLMTLTAALSWMLFEEYDSLTALAFAAFLMLLRNPFVIQSVSFQLSVVSVAGILLLGAPMQTYFWGKVPSAWKKGVVGRIVFSAVATLSVSLGATVATTPLSAWYFGTVSIIGLVTNLLTLWAVSVVFMAAAFVGAFGSAVPTLCAGLAWAASWLIRYIQLVAGILSKLPFAAVYTQSVYIVAWLIICYLLLAVFLLAGKKRKVLFASTCVGILILAIFLSVYIPKRDTFRLSVLDVGEGQCILLQSQGEYLLIDCGGDTDNRTADVAAQTLLSQGITRLDAIAITHYDRDHTGALQYLLTRVPADVVYLPDSEDGGFLDRFADVEIDREMIQQDTRIPFGGGLLTLTEPGQMKTDNENCMCVLFESEKCDILVTGDRSRSGEKRLLKSNVLPHVDILIGGHHGSKNSTSQELLEAVTPDIVIFSAGANNNYGHPAQEVLERVAAYQCVIYRTDRDGTVCIRR